MKKRHRTLAFRAIRGGWAVASRAGMVGKNCDGIMDKDERVRFAMIAAWKAGYRNGRADEKRKAGAK